MRRRMLKCGDKLEFARQRLEAIAAAFLGPDGSAKQRPPVGVDGKSTLPPALQATSLEEGGFWLPP